MTKEAIAAAATSMFHQYGIRSVTMDELASKLGGSKKTIYRFYKDKQELVEDIYLSLLDQVEQKCSEQGVQSVDAIEEMTGCWMHIKQLGLLYQHTVFRDLQRHYSNVFDRYSRFKQEFLYQLISKNIVRGQQEGLYRSDIQPGIIAVHQAENLELYYQTLSQRAEWTIDDIDQQLLRFNLHGLVNANGVSRMEEHLQTEFAVA